MSVMPAKAGIQRLKSLDPGQKHAGMTIKWESSDTNYISLCVLCALARGKPRTISVAAMFEITCSVRLMCVWQHTDLRHIG